MLKSHCSNLIGQQSVPSIQIWAVRSLIFVVTWHFHALHSKSVARILIAVFYCFVDGFEGEFNLCFNNYILIILLPVPDWFKTSAFKEEKSSRFNTEVCNSSSRPWFHPFLSFKKGTGVREGVLAWASCGHSCPVKIINTVLNDTLRLISGTNTSTHSAHNR